MQIFKLSSAVAAAVSAFSFIGVTEASAAMVQPSHHPNLEVEAAPRPLAPHTTAPSPTYDDVQPAIIPSNLGNSSPYDSFTSISCSTPGNCTAAGSFFSASGQNLPMTQTSTNGVWATAIPAVFTGALATSNRSGSFTSISCSAPGACTAVGDFAGQSITETSTNGVWAPVHATTFNPTIALSPDGANDHLFSVSCSSAGNCTAAGDYANGDGYNVPMTVTSTNGVWGDAVPATFPSDYPGASVFNFRAISCSSAGNCTAGGIDYRSNGFFATSTNGVWATAVVVPKIYLISSISCTAPGSCTAAGTLVDAQRNFRAMTITSTSGVFAEKVQVAIDPSLEPEYPGERLDAVSCTSPGNCTAVGSYWDVNYATQAVIATSTNGVWAAPTPLTLPADQSSVLQGAWLTAVSCAGPGSCTAAGMAFTSSGSQALTVTMSQGTWLPAVVASFAQGVSQAQRNDNFTAISCSAPGNCTAAGTFTDTNNNYPAMTQTLSQVAPVPSAPTGLAVTFGNQSATLKWIAPTPTEGAAVTGYHVTSSPSSQGCTTTGSFICTVSGLTIGTRYSFTVVALSGNGPSLPSTSVSGVAVKTATISSFRFENSTLTASLKDQVSAVARDLAAHGYKNVSVFGYANAGADSTLSVARARSVQSFLRLRLTALKVRGVTITITGGSTTTKFTTNHGADHSGNRCVVVAFA
jgi:outer membrane protein OmpA-like peptidoglycan-associated protein